MPKKGDLFYLAYQASQVVSLTVGYIVTGVSAAPFILIDWLVRKLLEQCCLATTDSEIIPDIDAEASPDDLELDKYKTKKQLALYAYNIPYLVSDADMEFGAKKICDCSFFGKVTYGLVASTAGVTASAVSSLATFALGAALTIPVAAAALSTILVVAVVAAIFGAIALGIKRLRSSAEETVESVVKCAKSLGLA